MATGQPTRSETVRQLTAELGFAAIPAEYTRPPDLVSKLMRLGQALLPGVRLDVAERLAVLHLMASRGDGEFTARDVERYKEDAIRGGYVSHSSDAEEAVA